MKKTIDPDCEQLGVLAKIMLDRSREKFRAGMRSDNTNELVSTYNGGEYCVVTTRKSQRLMLTTNHKHAKALMANHDKISSLFVSRVP